MITETKNAEVDNILSQPPLPKAIKLLQVISLVIAIAIITLVYLIKIALIILPFAVTWIGLALIGNVYSIDSTIFTVISIAITAFVGVGVNVALME